MGRKTKKLMKNGHNAWKSAYGGADAETSQPIADTDATLLPVEAPGDLRKRRNKERRERLLTTIAELIKIIDKPLADIIRDHALHHLPAMTLLRFRAVSSEWNNLISSPLFALNQTRTHRSISGLFYSQPPIYAPFDPKSNAIPDPSLSFLPHPRTSVRSSSNGLLCCLAPSISSHYFICNPATAEWTALPKPNFVHGPDPNVVLVFDPSIYNFRADYFLVCAFEIGGKGSHIYGFETFSSATGEWRISTEVFADEQLIPNSGVSVGGVAYWRTEMPTVLGYNPVADSLRVVPWPLGYISGATWQLGEMEGKLCCVTVTASVVAVHALGPSDWWTELGHFSLVLGAKGWEWGKDGGSTFLTERPWPLRFQSVNLEVMLLVDGTGVIGLDLASRRAREICFDGDVPSLFEDYLPHINTLAPVFPQVPMDFTL